MVVEEVYGLFHVKVMALGVWRNVGGACILLLYYVIIMLLYIIIYYYVILEKSSVSLFTALVYITLCCSTLYYRIAVGGAVATVCGLRTVAECGLQVAVCLLYKQ